MKKIKTLLISTILASGTVFGLTYSNPTNVSAAKHVEHVQKDYVPLVKEMILDDANEAKYINIRGAKQMKFDKKLNKEAQTYASKAMKYIFGGKHRAFNDKAFNKIAGKYYAKNHNKSIFTSRAWNNKRLNAAQTASWVEQPLFNAGSSGKVGKNYNKFIKTKGFKRLGVGFVYGYNPNNSKFPHESIAIVVAKK